MSDFRFYLYDTELYLSDTILVWLASVELIWSKKLFLISDTKFEMSAPQFFLSDNFICSILDFICPIFDFFVRFDLICLTLKCWNSLNENPISDCPTLKFDIPTLKFIIVLKIFERKNHFYLSDTKFLYCSTPY